MPSTDPVIASAAYCLSHVPSLVRYGSKPWREIAKDPSLLARLGGSLRSFAAAAAYPPNRTFIGALTPEALAAVPRPWYTSMPAGPAVATTGRFGEIVAEPLFYAALKSADVLEPALVEIDAAFAARIRDAQQTHPAFAALAVRDWKPAPTERIREAVTKQNALALALDGALAGCIRRDDRAEGREDDNLDARTLLEGLAAKASAALALRSLLARANIAPGAIDFLISCGEEATGDRYQRGGGGMAKAVGELCGCVNASGMDVKNFCAAPASALVAAGALVNAGLYERIAVVAGGSLAKLGMKSEAFLAAGIPILDDCLAAHAFLVTRDDGISPVLRLAPGAIGNASIGASASEEAVYRELLLEPLAALGLTLADIDKFAPELHNPEIMEHAGSGDVAHKNYRMIAAMAVLAGAIEKKDMPEFVARIGMPGFAPTQGHIPSGVAYLGHALEALTSGRYRRVMVLSKASLFLNRLTELYDGVSFVLERNPQTAKI